MGGGGGGDWLASVDRTSRRSLLMGGSASKVERNGSKRVEEGEDRRKRVGENQRARDLGGSGEKKEMEIWESPPGKNLGRRASTRLLRRAFRGEKDKRLGREGAEFCLLDSFGGIRDAA